MYKNLNILLVALLLSSCLTNSSSIIKERFHKGKFLISSTKANTSFGASIVEQYNKIIIQVSRPFFGNVANISIDSDGEMQSLSQEEFKFSFQLSKKDARKIYLWLKQCLKYKEFTDKESYIFVDEMKVRMICSFDADKVYFEIKGREYDLSGYVK